MRRAFGLGLALLLLPAGVPGQGTRTAAASAPADHPGAWSEPFRLPVIGIHAQVLPTGRVLLFDYPRGHGMNAWRWDPVTGALADVHLKRRHDLFCAGHSLLPDGRVFITGGTKWHAHGEVGTTQNAMFDPASSSWPKVASLREKRWYPSNVTLPDGRVLIFSGQANERKVIKSVEVFDPATGRMTLLPRSANRPLDLYPRMHLLPDGRVFYSGPRPRSAFFDPATSSWQSSDDLGYPGRWAGASVLLPGLDRVLTFGGTRNKRPTDTAEIIDLAGPDPSWRFTAPMARPRMHANGVLLPDGTVLAVGGGQKGDYSKPVREAELFDPLTETWTTLAAQRGGRAYHSSAVLLPDGRVLSSGMDHGNFERTGEIYSPPYLFRGPRPEITSAPAEIGYGTPFTLTSPDAASIDRIALVRPASATHGIDFEQRLVDLPFTAGAGSLSVTGPPGPASAPPGHYMVFLVTSDGVPSVASWVHLA